MATRRTKKQHSVRDDGPETAEHMQDRVLGAFDRWLAEREPNRQRRGDISDIVHTACDLKRIHLGESNPADWDPAIAVEVVGQVIPHWVFGVEDRYINTLVPAMLTYVEFLEGTGRWKPHNDAGATRTALSTLDDDLPGRFKNPDQVPMAAGGITRVTLDAEIDINGVAGFIERFNALPHEWRQRLTDAPGMPSPLDELGFYKYDAEKGLWDADRPTGPLDGPDVLGDLQAAIATGTAAIDFVAEESVPITVPDARSELAALLATPLLTRMTALTEWVRPGRKLTSTMAMRRSDTAEWARRFGILSPAGSTPNSMWDWPELAAPWSIAAGCGLIDSSTTKARPGPNSGIFGSADLSAQILCARDAVEMLIDGLVDAGDELSELDAAVIGLLIALFACMCRPEGADLSVLRTLASPVPNRDPADFFEAISRILFILVLSIVDMLEEWGFVSRADGRTSVPLALRPALVQAIYGADAPCSISLEPGAIPLRSRSAAE